SEQTSAASGRARPGFSSSVREPAESGGYVLGSNLTGIAGMTTEMDAARLRLLQELNPAITNIGVLRNGMRPNQPGQWTKLTQAADPRLHLEIAPEPAGHGLPLTKCEAYNRVYEQSYGSS